MGAKKSKPAATPATPAPPPAAPVIPASQIAALQTYMNQATQAIQCDATCQKNKKLTELKDKFDAAKNKNADIDAAAIEYYNETDDPNDLDKYFGDKALADIAVYRDSFKKANENRDIKQKSLDEMTLHESNVNELLDKYNKENEELQKKLDKLNADTTTKDRKSYYEDQGSQSLDYAYWYLCLFYIVVAITAAIALFVNSSMQIMYKLLICIMFIVYPFVSTYLLSFVISIAQQIYNLLPTNVLL
jgi:hypothetical protein